VDRTVHSGISRRATVIATDAGLISTGEITVPTGREVCGADDSPADFDPSTFYCLSGGIEASVSQ